MAAPVKTAPPAQEATGIGTPKRNRIHQSRGRNPQLSASLEARFPLFPGGSCFLALSGAVTMHCDIFREPLACPSSGRLAFRASPGSGE